MNTPAPTPPRIAVQGEPGCFSHAAAREAWGELELVPCEDFPELFRAVLEGRAEGGVVPVENALAGAVSENLDLLVQHPLRAVAELYVRVEMCLAVRPDGADDPGALTAVASHPVALRQCRRFFADHPHLARVVAGDTAGSIRALMEGEPGWDGAIGPGLAADLYGARILRRGIEDDPLNFTRFLAVAAPGEAEGGAGVGSVGRPPGLALTGRSKVSLVFTAAHSPGSLHAAIGVFAGRGLDLTRMESRPIPGRPWEYRFHADVRGPDAGALAAALEALEAVTYRIWTLGIYPETAVPGSPTEARAEG